MLILFKKEIDMKFLKSISLFFFLPIICFVLGAFVYSKCDNFFYPKENDNKNYVKQDLSNLNSTSIDSDHNKQEEKIQVNAEESVTTCDTIYMINEYDLVNHTDNEKQEPIPVYFMGLNREELMIAVENYEMSPSFQDLQDGFQTIELTYFSPEKIIVTKSYEMVPKEEVYYLKVENNKIVVYQSDMETIYLYTEIELDDLPDDLQQEIINVKCINNLESLYDFLESHSS